MSLTKWFIFSPTGLLLTTDNTLPTSPTPPVVLPSRYRKIALPSLDGTPCVAIALDTVPSLPSACRFVNLRTSFDFLPRKDFQQAGKAQELLYWDQNSQYCGNCGAPMQPTSDISKLCTRCKREEWASVSVAVIILIERKAASGQCEDDEVLLIQSKNFRGDYYGLVAGFVETGETLEEAACREIMEETGICVQNLQYRASQPWPFPSVLMVGFTAEYKSGTLHLQTSELRKGDWFKRSALPPLPGNISLARRLIEEWKQR